MEYSIIGTITRVVDDSDPENIITETLEGYHVNARGEVPESWEAAEIPEPKQLHRVFAGGGTRYFRFEDEAAFRAVEPSDDESTLP